MRDEHDLCVLLVLRRGGDALARRSDPQLPLATAALIIHTSPNFREIIAA